MQRTWADRRHEAGIIRCNGGIRRTALLEILDAEAVLQRMAAW